MRSNRGHRANPTTEITTRTAHVRTRAELGSMWHAAVGDMCYVNLMYNRIHNIQDEICVMDFLTAENSVVI